MLRTLWLLALVPFAFSSVGARAACPELEGTFVCRQGALPRILKISTRQERGTYRYQLGADGPELTADGVARAQRTEGSGGLVRASCDGGSLRIESRAEGGASITMRISRLGADRVKVESSSPSVAGFYDRLSL